MRSFFTESQIPNAADAGLTGGLWRNRLVWIAVLWGFALVAYRDTAWSIVTAWLESDTYSHGFLILPISLWLIWEQRGQFSGRAPSVSYLALAAIGSAGLLWFAGSLAYVQIVQQFALVAVLIALVWFCVGTRAARRLMFPLAYLFFAVPFGEGLVPPLMELTATQTVDLVRMTGIPVYREGLYFSLPTGNWSVVKACSGVRYLIASLALGTIFAYLNYRSLTRRLLFIAAAFVVPVIANVLRAYMIVMIGHLSDMKLATGVDHLVYGWVFFGLVMLLLFWVGSWFSDIDKGRAGEKSVADNQAGVPVEPPAAQAPRSISFLSVAAAAIIVLLFPLMVAAIEQRTVLIPEDDLVLTGLPAAWRSIDAPAWSWRPPLYGADKQTQAFFMRDGRVFGVSVGVYLKQQQGDEMISYRNGLVDKQDEGWTAEDRREQSVSAEGGDFEVAAASLSNRVHTLSVYAWYQIGGFTTANKYAAKLKELVDKATLRKSASVRILVFAESAAGESAADALLNDFASAARPQIEATVAQLLEPAQQ